MNNDVQADDKQRGLFQALIGDGCPPLTFVGIFLIICGGFALFLSAMNHFLPHDIEFLGMTARELCAFQDCRIVHFMLHDRTAFGGALISIGTLYAWLAQFPLRHGEAWAWWIFVFSGLIGFGSFLTYLGYGYLDAWHAAATIFLLPVYITGLAKSYSRLREPKNIKSIFTPSVISTVKSAENFGRACLLATGSGMLLGGLTIMFVGMTTVFVPQDLMFMDLTVDDLHRINPRLVPLIAHDRAGFGGVLATCGIAVLIIVWRSAPSRSMWQALCIAGISGFGTAIGVHPVIQYNNLFHLAPAYLGLLIFITGLAFSFQSMYRDRKTKEFSLTKSGEII